MMVLLACAKSFVKIVIHLFQPMHICQIPHVTFRLNFASIFSAITHNFPVLFLAQTLYILVKGAN